MDHPFQFRAFLGRQRSRRSARWMWPRNIASYDFDFAHDAAAEIGVDLVDQLWRLMLEFERRAVIRHKRQRRSAGARPRQTIRKAMLGKRLACKFGPPRHKFDLRKTARGEMMFEQRASLLRERTRPAPNAKGRQGLSCLCRF